MTDGLITRIGKWIDRKWEASATWRDLEEQESKCSQRHLGVIGLIANNAETFKAKIAEIHLSDQSKELADLKTRIEKIELYAGMTRKVDPTKPPVAKSAFTM